MVWIIKLEAKSGWGEVETIEIGRLNRRVVGLTAEEVGPTLADGEHLLGERAHLVLQTQMEEFTTWAHMCGECLKLRRLRDGRTRKVQTQFGTITVTAPRISACPYRHDWDFGGCRFVVPGRSATGPLHARAPAVACRIERQAFLPGGAAWLLATLLPMPAHQSRDDAQSNGSRCG
jgi:hypothetical protein